MDAIMLQKSSYDQKLAWQSIRSVNPPCPGILSPKSCVTQEKAGQGGWKRGMRKFMNVGFTNLNSTLILKALLKPLAKKPPNGAMIDANKPRHKACH